jgi:osmotically-inducible protein OsmY
MNNVNAVAPVAPAAPSCRRAGLCGPWLPAVLLASVLSSACAPMIFGGLAMGGVMMQADRRSAGTIVEDQSIEIKAASRANAIMEGRGHLNFTSYNRIVLVTGEVLTQEERNAVTEIITGVDQVRQVINEVAVTQVSSMSERSQDAVLTGKVRATLIDAGDLESRAFKVTTERGIVYLMGRVTRREAERAVSLVRTIDGVRKVVQATETISDDELIDLRLRSSRSTL